MNLYNKKEIWQELERLGLTPGTSPSRSKNDKTRKVAGFNLACKWKKKYRGWTRKRLVYSDELRQFRAAIQAYKNDLELNRCLEILRAITGIN